MIDLALSQFTLMVGCILSAVVMKLLWAHQARQDEKRWEADWLRAVRAYEAARLPFDIAELEKECGIEPLDDSPTTGGLNA